MNTLRTIEETHSKWEHEGNLSDFTYDLQQEAIKVYKSEALLGEENHITPPTKYWIKHFFNLTEEDLK